MSCSFCGGEDSFIYLVCERRHLICNSCLHQQTILKLFVDSLKHPPGKCPLCTTTIAGSLEQILYSFGHEAGHKNTDDRPRTPGKGGGGSGVVLAEIDLGEEECMFVPFLKAFKCVFRVTFHVTFPCRLYLILSLPHSSSLFLTLIHPLLSNPTTPT